MSWKVVYLRGYYNDSGLYIAGYVVINDEMMMWMILTFILKNMEVLPMK